MSRVIHALLGRKTRKTATIAVVTPELRAKVATFGPWADHARGCGCNVCR